MDELNHGSQKKCQKKNSCILFDSFSAHYLCVYSCLWMHTDSNDGYTMTDLIGWEQSTDGTWKQRGFTVLPTRILVKAIACDDKHRMSSIVARSSILVVKPTPVQVVMHTHTHMSYVRVCIFSYKCATTFFSVRLSTHSPLICSYAPGYSSSSGRATGEAFNRAAGF